MNRFVGLNENFEGTRCRFQRLRDSRFFSGWVISIYGHELTVRLNENEAHEVGDIFFMQVFGDGESAMSRVALKEKVGSSWKFALEHAPQFVPSQEQVRVLISDQKATIKLGWFETVADVIDVSPSGMGIVLRSPVEKSEIVKMSMFTLTGAIQAKGEVCYCRTIDGLSGFYRVGVELYPMDSLTAAKWNQLIQFLLKKKQAA